MSPSQIDQRVVTEKIAIINRMLAEVRRLPTSDLDAFLEDHRTPAAAESYLRRALEALMDLGRHFLAKGFGVPVEEYANIAERLKEVGVLGSEESSLLRKMAGYRNRMVHFYDEITHEELYGIVTEHVDGFSRILGPITTWLRENPDKVRETP